MSDAPAAVDPAWLERFHAGDPAALEACYRQHYETVNSAAGRLLRGADRESVVHEVFFRVLSRPDFRASFRGGSLGAWLATVARNLAMDAVRSQQRQRAVSLNDAEEPGVAVATRFEEASEARLLVERFRREILPEKWEGVFVARFLEQRDQRDAAAKLGIARTTLAYQELRVRALLKKFLLEGEKP
jgi:RNA polymerase sigma-70 factor (ECF subfamily)